MRANCEHPAWRVIEMRLSSTDPLHNYVIFSCKDCGNYRCLDDTYERLKKIV